MRVTESLLPSPLFLRSGNCSPVSSWAMATPFACLLVNPTRSYSDKSLLVCHIASEFSALRHKAPGYWSSSEPPRGHQTVSKLHSERRLGHEAPFLPARSEPGCPFHTANSEHDQIKLIIMPYVCSNHVPLQRTSLFIILILTATCDISRRDSVLSSAGHMGFSKTSAQVGRGGQGCTSGL